MPLKGGPLAKLQGANALHLFRRGIKTPKDLFSKVTMSLHTWEDLQVQFRLIHPERQIIDLLIFVIAPNLLHKLGIHSSHPWWKDWKCYPTTLMTSYNPRLGYWWLVPHLLMIDTLNQHWHFHSSHKTWSLRFSNVLHAITNPKISHFS